MTLKLSLTKVNFVIFGFCLSSVIYAFMRMTNEWQMINDTVTDKETAKIPIPH